MEALSGEDRRCMYSLLACHIVDVRAGVIQSSIVEAGSALPPSPQRPPAASRQSACGKAAAQHQRPKACAGNASAVSEPEPAGVSPSPCR